MIISAKFITSLDKFDKNFASHFSEVAFLGRSNVGKSSLINSLCKQNNLKFQNLQVILVFHVLLRY